VCRKNRVLITGAAGFVGSHLTHYLHEKGFEIWAARHRCERRFPFRIRWVDADMTCFRDVMRLLDSARPHYIFHLAGQAVPRMAWEDPSATHRLNVGGSVFLLEGATKFVPESRVILFSSGQVYGATFFWKRRVSEEDPVNPLTPYAGSKLLAEMAGLNFFARHGLDVVIVRPFNHVGTAQNTHLVLAEYCRQIALMEKGRKSYHLEVGNVDVTRDFLHVRDAVRAYHLLAVRGKGGEIYNVGSGKGIYLKRILEFLRKESKVNFKVVQRESWRSRNDFPFSIADCSKLRRLNWQPRESVWGAVREILQEWRKRVG